ncbi:hypothetical protein GCM10027271_05310 [Saccharopolyspora gloriosae]|uniref:Excreted virulence factor EspC (Type VII ESX diderm) n=1 Tax=Saccharopolyspora gloriosae TaxID=455344 RepID=A0A840NNZ2_9PSEU|nr:hypothetical protein [Saccharopolyspora gloriosae]MBB5072078.1 hypothetical protein [Saccharopolyspora gloriosae]
MAGIRIETDELARHAEALRAAGSAVGEAGRERGAAPSGADFGAWGAAAAEPYDRLVGALRQRIFGTAHAVADAGDELAAVLARHEADDEDHAAELGREGEA